MKKRIFTAIAALTVSVCLASCNNKEAAQGNEMVSPDDGGYYLEVPQEWEISRTDGLVAAYLPGDTSKVNVTVYHFDTGLNESVSSADYWEKYKAQFEDTFTEMTVEKVEETTLGGIAAQHVYYTVNLGADSFSCQTILGVYGRDVYVLTLTQGAKTQENTSYVDYTDTFKAIAGSFRVK